MRDILFRGKRRDTGEWVEGQYYKRTLYYSDPSVKHYIIVSTEDLGYDQAFEYYEVIPETIGQYTGMKDKNGIKIFDGDIVETKYGRLCFVVWFSSKTYCGWDLEVVSTVENARYTRTPPVYDLFDAKNLKIVDNIHDNPELLESK